METICLHTLKAWYPPLNKCLSFVAQATILHCDLKNRYLVIVWLI